MKKSKTTFISLLLSLTLIAGILTSPVIAAGESKENYKAKLANGLVAHWTFDDNYQESASGLVTNLGGKKLTYTEGIHGKAAVFNGKDNYLYVDPDPILNFGNSRTENNDNFSIAAWVNLGDIAYGDKFLLDKGQWKGWSNNDDCYWTNPYRVYFSDNEVAVELSNAFQDENAEPKIFNQGSSDTSGKYVDGQEWFLLTVTYDGKRVKVYKDNELLMQSNYTDGITFNEEELYIGVDYRLENFFKGAVDDLRLYNICLSYDDVDMLYQYGLADNSELVEPSPKMVAYYKFEENLKDSSSFKNDAEKVAVGGTTKYVVGKNGKAITMSKGNYIRIPAADQLNFDTGFTISFWLKLDKEGNYPILYRQNPAYIANNDNYWTYLLSIDSYNKGKSTSVSMETRAYSPEQWSPVTGPTLSSYYYYDEVKLDSTTWNHYAYTYSDGILKSYLNGVLQNKSDESDFIDISNASGDLLIGFDGSTFISGAIDELKIFNFGQSATDIKNEFKRVDSISLSSTQKKSITTIGKGKTVKIASIIYTSKDTGKSTTIKYSNKNITFKSSNTKILKVSSDGKLTGVTAGKAKVTITYGAHSVTYTVTVK